ncbi:hypothetical protein BV98_001519 [Sphingobium herbicidovorans NBRC 16415]|uniref:Uncharacterized protein n=1 Tax=Sphingobium herbicidovorans (strain ATCC 700291 / DSM 11019 / CCUG 56400 / KCTC 2939 / LMG 18315 / NBRC 16415 / MH) TaxID=1219045 RepID=A0A086PA99_SPHHM|nr:hypothetical protein [Sphingobium herbicidovorans]KFG90317.1 hypothetical protein BV98_001519 [Sphingobium herbicidovorans NBRC 16415]
MTQHIFFSWQIDRLPLTGRNLIERALGDAIAAIKADAEIDPAHRELAIDRDTSGVPGSPPLVETIFAKVDAATAFLSDLTYVATRSDGRLMPNPNVLLEHGWALRALSWRRIISVMNIAHGSPEDHPLPFDLQHFRRPILYNCPDDADEAERRAARVGLALGLRDALRAILNDAVVAAPAAAPAEPHPLDVDLLGKVRDQFPVRLQRFFHDHNFGEPFRRDILNPLYEMNEDWRGARFEFHDRALQAAWAEVRARAEALGNLTGQYLFVLDANIALCSPKTDEDRRRGTQPSTVRAVDEMNKAATAFAGALDAFERVARDRVRVAAGVVAAPPAAAADPWEAAKALLERLGNDEVTGRVPGIVSKPSVKIRLVPAIIAERPRLVPAQVAKAQLQFAPDVHARVATDADGDQWWSADVPRNVGKPNVESRWRTRLVRPGAIEFEATIGSRIDDDPRILVDGRDLEGRIVAGVERLAVCLAEVGLGGPALLAIGFDGVEDVELTRARGGGRLIRRPGFLLPVVELADPLAQPGNQLNEAFDILWQTSGWGDGSPSFGRDIWDGYAGTDDAAAR